LAAILANPVMITAYKAGVPGAQHDVDSMVKDSR
jgi:hypothetical protein